MKNKNELLKSMSVLRKDLYNFITELENFEHNNNIDINDLIIEKYPFDKDLYEKQLEIMDWLYNIAGKIEDLKQSSVGSKILKQGLVNLKKKLENSIGKKISIYHEDRVIKTGTVYEVGMCGDFIGIKLKNVCVEDLDLGTRQFKNNTLSLLYEDEIESYISFLED